MTYPVSTAGYRLRLQYGYQYGLVQQVAAISESPSVVLWQATAMNPSREVTAEHFGNGVVTSRLFDSVTGLQSSIQAGVGGGAGIQNQSYLYDKVGNVIQSQNDALGLTENFYYDDVYRLTSSDLVNSQGASSTNLTVHYDLMGNITSRSDVAAGASWSYNSTHPHRLVSAGGTTLSYTQAGEVFSRGGDVFAWLQDGLLGSVTSPSGASVRFYYKPDGTPLGSYYSAGTSTEAIDLIGEDLERVNYNEFRHYIRVLGRTVAVYSRNASGITGWHYLIGDREQSVAAITDATGAVSANESFAPFGARRDAASWTGAASSAATSAMDAITRDGYTGHRMFEAMGLIHMNGRVEESTIGRFLSPDPVVSNPANTQDFNPYSYVDNNPLTLVDPTGFDSTFEEDGSIGIDPGTGMWEVTIPGLLNSWENPGLDLGALSQDLQDSGVAVNSIQFDRSKLPKGGGGGGLTIGFWRFCSATGCTVSPHVIPCIYCGFNVGILPTSPGASATNTAPPQNPGNSSGSVIRSPYSSLHGWFTASAMTTCLLGCSSGWDEGILAGVGGAAADLGAVLAASLTGASGVLAFAPTATATQDDDSGQVFYHGTDLNSYTSLVGGAPLAASAAAANSNKFRGALPGFYLATDPDTAWHFAAVAGDKGSGGTVLQYYINNTALSGLQSAGAVLGPIPGSKPAFPGQELFVPVTAFPAFNSYLATGRIIVQPYTGPH